MQAASRIAQQALKTNSPTTAGCENDNDEQEQHALVLVNYVFISFEKAFGQRFKAQFGKTKDDIKASQEPVKLLWHTRFVKEGIRRFQVDYALEQIFERRLQWPPELTAFLELCDQCVCQELPTANDAMQEIVDWHCKYRGIDERPELTHRVVSLVNDEIGYLCKELTAEHFQKRFKKAWDKWVLAFRRNALPPPRVALPEPRPEQDPRIAALSELEPQKASTRALIDRLDAIRCRNRHG